MDRRTFLSCFAAAGFSGVMPASASSNILVNVAMRGSLNAAEMDVVPGALDDQSRKFNRMLQAASDRQLPVFLPAGDYVVSNLKLPRTVRLSGVSGATRIIYGGDGHLFLAEQTDLLHLEGLTIDGANRWLGDQTQGLVDARGVGQLVLDGCHILGSGKHGIALDRVGGRVERCEISGAADAGLHSVEAAGLQIVGNGVTGCGNGGILVHRWQPADDGTIITGNRIRHIGARAGGTGQNGNGINVFRANGVNIANNSITGCAFSAIRANSASNLIVQGNSCLASGETAIYAEFAFEGAIINANIVDGAANGISVVNFNGGGRMAVCSGNIIRNLVTQGPYPADPPGFGNGISVEADVTVTGNVIENAPRAGIAIGWGEFMRNVVASSNIIRKCDVGIIVSVADGAGPAIITDNLIDSAAKGAIVGYRWAEPATDDLALSPVTSNTLTVTGNRVN